MSSPVDSTAAMSQRREDESRIPQLMCAYIICLVIAYVGVILRFVARTIKKTPLKADDWLIVLSLAFTTAFTGIEIALTTRDGLGRHEKYITDAKFFALGILIGEVVYTIAIFVVKLSMLFLLHRIFPRRRFLYGLWVIGGVMVAYSMVQIICVIVHCIPIKALWNPTLPAHCINLNDVILVCSSFNIATDVAILCLPILELRNLKVTRRQKLQIMSIFLLGGLVCIFSLIRITKLPELSLTDPGWTSALGAMWSVVECGIATLCACLPTMRPIYNWFFNAESTNASKETDFSNNKRKFPSSWGSSRKQTNFEEVTSNDTWPLKKVADDPTMAGKKSDMDLEMASLHEK